MDDPFQINAQLSFAPGASLPTGWNLQAPGVTQHEQKKLIKVHPQGPGQPVYFVSYSQIGWYMWRNVPSLVNYAGTKMALSARVRSNAPVYIQCGNVMEKHKSQRHSGNDAWEVLTVVFNPSNKMNDIIAPVVHMMPRSSKPPKYVQVEITELKLMPYDQMKEHGGVELNDAVEQDETQSKANSAPETNDDVTNNLQAAYNAEGPASRAWQGGSGPNPRSVEVPATPKHSAEIAVQLTSGTTPDSTQGAPEPPNPTLPPPATGRDAADTMVAPSTRGGKPPGTGRSKESTKRDQERWEALLKTIDNLRKLMQAQQDVHTAEMKTMKEEVGRLRDEVTVLKNDLRNLEMKRPPLEMGKTL